MLGLAPLSVAPISALDDEVSLTAAYSVAATLEAIASSAYEDLVSVSRPRFVYAVELYAWPVGAV